MDKNKGFFSHKWALRLVSLILAIFLFTYVNGSKNGFLQQNTRNSNDSSALMSDKSVTIKMPLDLTIDNSKYVVTGYPQYVKVRVSGPSALVTTTSNTQNFKVYADLSRLGAGTHRVPVKTSGLNSELQSTINPEYINVTIQPRRTINMKVSVRLNSRSLSNGYQLGRPRTDVDTVQVTGPASEVNRVSRIVAFVAVPRDAKSTLQRQVTLQALDHNGQTLNVVISPATTNVTVPISKGNESSSDSDSDSAVMSDSSTSSRREERSGSSSSETSTSVADTSSSTSSSSSQQ